MGQNGREFVKQFEPKKIWDQWEDWITETVQEYRTVPTVSVVIPVHNVEQYLRQCLGSVVNQTMRNIQIICVNDGSTDGSRDILQEYADKDNRILILDQENRGAGSARNAAYPHIRGRYTYFADPDDWLEPDLCGQAVQRIEETNAEMVYFRYVIEKPGTSKKSFHFNKKLPQVRIAGKHRTAFLFMLNMPWCKLWRTDFLLQNQICCSEMTPYEDIILNWKGCVLAGRIAILDKMLYHYRFKRPGSAAADVGWRHAAIIGIHDEIDNELKRIGKYRDYQDVFLQQRLTDFYHRYVSNIREEDKEIYVRLVQSALTSEDRDFLRKAPQTQLSDGVREFYAGME